MREALPMDFKKIIQEFKYSFNELENIKIVKRKAVQRQKGKKDKKGHFTGLQKGQKGQAKDKMMQKGFGMTVFEEGTIQEGLSNDDKKIKILR